MADKSEKQTAGGLSDETLRWMFEMRNAGVLLLPPTWIATLPGGYIIELTEEEVELTEEEQRTTAAAADNRQEQRGQQRNRGGNSSDNAVRMLTPAEFIAMLPGGHVVEPSAGNQRMTAAADETTERRNPDSSTTAVETAADIGSESGRRSKLDMVDE